MLPCGRLLPFVLLCSQRRASELPRPAAPVAPQAQAAAAHRGLAGLQAQLAALKAQLTSALAAQERQGTQLAGQAEKLLVGSPAHSPCAA
jgi:hypothetical protein